MLKTCQIAVSKPNIETACGASEVPDSSFEAQQKQFVGPHGKEAKGRRKLLGGF